MALGPRIGEDAYLDIFGLKKVIRRGKPVMTAGPNSRLERYVMNQQRYLWKLQRRGRVDLFWKTAERLLRSSKAFRLLALRNVKPNWYKDTDWKKVQRWMIELNHICYRPSETYEITRTNIPKKDGGIRYINDPGVPWRCYLWMWNLMLHYFANPKLNENQHGHRAGKGAATCWKQILTEVVNANYIYEFDYMKFHDLITRTGTAQALLRFGFPEEIARKLVHLCSPYVKGSDPDDPVRMAMSDEFGMFHHYYRGVVQGNNIAAMLGMIVLEDMEVYDLEHGKYIGYADDGILYGESELVMEEWKSKLDPLKGTYPKEAASN